MQFREATIADIPQIQIVRNSVKENMLSDPALVTDKDCEEYMTIRGKGWVCLVNNRIVGFVLLMHRENNTAQLRYFYLEPEYRGIGLGSRLMDLYMRFLHACGYQKSYLWTTHELTIAASIYKGVGFQLTEEKESTSFGKRLREQRYDLVLI